VVPVRGKPTTNTGGSRGFSNVPAGSFLSSAWRTRNAAVGEERGEHWSQGGRQSRGLFASTF
jgi:hypothetical protein